MSDIIVIGTSLHGMQTLEELFRNLRVSIPVAVVQHMGADAENYLPQHLDELAPMKFKEAEDRELMCGGTVYIAPPDYHLLTDGCGRLYLSAERKVNYARPSVDVLFESAAYSCGKRCIGIILTGAGSDGSGGLELIGQYGGRTIVQVPEEAYAPEMPKAAIRKRRPDDILKVADICALLNDIAGENDG